MRKFQRKVISLVCLAPLLFGCGQQPQHIHPNIRLASDRLTDSQEVVANSYIVAFKSKHSNTDSPSYFQEYQRGYGELRNLAVERRDIENVRFLTSINLDDAVESGIDMQKFLFSKTLGETNRIANIAEVNFLSKDSAEKTLNEWEQSDLLYYAEPNYISRLSSSFESAKQKADTFSHLSAINLSDALTKIEEGGTSYAELAANGPIIAVLDSGVDYLHPMLENRIYQPPTGKAGCSGDSFGCNTTQASLGNLGDGKVYPYGTSAAGEMCGSDEESENIDRVCGHGTHVSGIIAAEATGSDEYMGVCPFCRILPVKIVGDTKYDNSIGTGIADSSIIAALKYIINFVDSNSNAAIKVANMSFGKYQRSETVSILVNALSKINGGTLLVAAASNDDSMAMAYPAAMTEAVAVASVQIDGIKSSFSNFGKWVSISSYGDELRSSFPGGLMEIQSGTSQASPVVAGVAGLVVAQSSNAIGQGSLKARLLSTANPSIYQASENSVYYQPADGSISNTPLLGYGVINASAAVRNATESQRIVIAGNNRVSGQGCGTIASKENSKHALLLLFLLLPTTIQLFLMKRSG